MAKMSAVLVSVADEARYREVNRQHPLRYKLFLVLAEILFIALLAST